ncbi:hypothetical protein TRVL_09263 [Trypanosoma vivax]|nr:hypothetical protein TRVL_09263 [Trypanosoma vivax]
MHVTFAARSLVYAFINSQSKWKVCKTDHQRGCCLSVEKTDTACSKDARSCWNDCLAFSSTGASRVGEVLSLFGKNGDFNKFLTGVELQVGRGSTSCEHTEYDSYRPRGDFGGLFVVDASGYYYGRLVMKLEGSFHSLGNLRALVCMFARAGYGQMMGTMEDCADICKDTTEMQSVPKNKLGEVSGGVRETDQQPKRSTRQVPHKDDTSKLDGEAPKETADGEHVTGERAA